MLVRTGREVRSYSEIVCTVTLTCYAAGAHISYVFSLVEWPMNHRPVIVFFQ